MGERKVEPPLKAVGSDAVLDGAHGDTMNNWSESKEAYLSWLDGWRQELSDNKNGLAYMAPRAIKLLETEIEGRWPGTLPPAPSNARNQATERR